MQFDNIPAGKNPPEDIYVAIEIPANSSPVKYELDKDMGLAGRPLHGDPHVLPGQLRFHPAHPGRRR